MKELFKYLNKPEVYAQSSCKFWEDEHISKGMLEAHLNPDLEAASRKHEFIDQSVKWIHSLASQKTHPKLLDLGCGPGLYTDRLNQLGYEVTGIDISKRSIEYARTITNTTDVSYFPVYPGKVLLQITTSFIVTTETVELIQKVAPAGVKILVDIVQVDEVFGFDGENGFPAASNIKGYGETGAGNEAIGGPYVERIV